MSICDGSNPMPKPSREDRYKRQAEQRAERQTAKADVEREARNARKPIGARQRFRILARDKFTCVLCRRRREDLKPGEHLEVDHRIPVRDGGDNRDENLRAICNTCNVGRNWQPTP